MNVAKGRLDQFIKWLVSKFSNDEIVMDDNVNSKVASALATSQSVAAIQPHFVFRTTTTVIGVISANGGTKWVTLNKPSTALWPRGYYIYNSVNTRQNIYAFSSTSVAICNLASSATSSDLKLDVYWVCWE